MAVDFAANTPRELPVRGGVKSNERFHRLAWGGLSSTPSMPYGILAGGMVDGAIGLWNPAAMMKCAPALSRLRYCGILVVNLRKYVLGKSRARRSFLVSRDTKGQYVAWISISSNPIYSLQEPRSQR